MQPAIAVTEPSLNFARGLEHLVTDLHLRARQAVEQAGGRVVSPSEAQGLIWLDIGDANPLVQLLDENPNISWVQLPWAGIDSFAGSSLFDRSIQFTCAKASYGEQVGEHVLMLAMACLRHLVDQARRRTWHMREPESLFRKRVTVLGAGGIAQTFTSLLQPFDCDVTVLRRSSEPFPGANRTLQIGQLHEVLPHTDVLVLALALTPKTHQIIGARELELLPSNAVLINVARGAHVDTEALVKILAAGQLAAAGLDVTDPEPLPTNHPLWNFNNVLITSHCADSTEFVIDKLVERINENVRCFAAGQPLIGLVDNTLGY